MEDKQYVILGIHHGEGKQRQGDTPVAGVPEGKVFARVRMFVGGQLVDENFELPELPPGVPTETEHLFYGSMMEPKIKERMNELSENTEASAIHAEEHDTDQAVSEEATV